MSTLGGPGPGPLMGDGKDRRVMLIGKGVSTGPHRVPVTPIWREWGWSGPTIDLSRLLRLGLVDLIMGQEGWADW